MTFVSISYRHHLNYAYKLELLVTHNLGSVLRVSIRKDTVHCKNALPGVWDEDLAAVLHEGTAVFGEDSALTVLRVRPVWGG